MEKKSLYQYLNEYGQSDHAAFHMPGHKRQRRMLDSNGQPMELPWQLDITEIDGFDNLHHAEGILKESMDLAASFYGSERTLYSINGSTAGILSAIFAVTKPGDTILMARNCHKSVYHGVFLRELVPLYVYPQIDQDTGIACGYSPEDIKEMLISHPEIRAVVITSPTYEGVISDIAAIADIVHGYQIPLVVDEAHGAHLTMKSSKCVEFPESATMLGADLVIQSLHKTLPALTQTAVLHVCTTWLQRAAMYAKEAARYMSMFQTSSPSYLLMASIDGGIRYLMSEEGQKDQENYYDRLIDLRKKLKAYQHVHLLSPDMKGKKLDPSKILLQADGMSGKVIYDYLRLEHHLQPEMCTDSYVLLMTSVFDTEEMYQRLVQACDQLENKIQSTCDRKEQIRDGFDHETSIENTQALYRIPRPHQELTPSQAMWMPTEEISIKESVGRISAEYAYQYPPGIPLLVPGERIEEDILQRLMDQAQMGLQIQGLDSMDGSSIRVILEN